MLDKADGVVLFGGGLDSCALVEMKVREQERLMLLYVGYGAKAEPAELLAARYLSMRYRDHIDYIYYPLNHKVLFPPCAITNAPMTERHADDIVAGRNMIFAALAYPLAVKLRAHSIYLCASPVTHIAPENVECYRDVQAPFVHAFNQMLHEGYGPDGPRLRAPLLNFATKREYVAAAYDMNRELFHYSHSCYQSGDSLEPCGRCSHCKERKVMEAEVTGSAR